MNYKPKLLGKVEEPYTGIYTFMLRLSWNLNCLNSEGKSDNPEYLRGQAELIRDYIWWKGEIPEPEEIMNDIMKGELK